MDILLEARKDSGEPLTFKEMRDEVDTFMFEGHDTTSSGMMWTLWLMGKYPEVQTELQAELDELFGAPQRGIPLSPTYEDVHKLRFLKLVLRESHRFYSPVPGAERRATSDIDIGRGVIVPAGAALSIGIQELHNNPSVWPNPEVFDPRRHQQDDAQDSASATLRNVSAAARAYSFVPFSAGPRNCVGQNFAETEEKVVLVTLLHYFRVEAVGEAQPFAEMVMRNKGKLLLRLSRRAA
eukprot:TRINITY_DN2898_c0_g3_i2.p2 TRINITY_DN2898_c0_g3~~TRINITY_DN2898_c0_g3_i2.p2  ORF type:complete len:238 (-),score=60.11 TRINITY_DN2898_c0_g3_i2:38-751(-)